MKSVLLSLVLVALPSPASAATDAVLAWNQTAASAGFAAGLDNEFGCVDPLHESRMFAMMHVAIHDALNAIDRRFKPYALDVRVSPAASPDAAVAAAAHTVLVAVLKELPAEESEPRPQPRSRSPTQRTPRRWRQFLTVFPRWKGS